MARSAGRDRTVCETCDLPYYADAEECPYCGTQETGFVFGTTVSTGRSRTTCPDCGLPHYEDTDGCPYCAVAGSESEAGEATSAETVETESEPAGTERTVDDGGGLVSRLKRTLGF